jgi:glycosyltransferase involved in cell wall biosynthesis
MGFILGIDASRNRSGGAIAHLKGVLSVVEPSLYGISKIHLWGYEKLNTQIPDRQWLIKHSPKALGKNIVNQLVWQSFFLPKELEKYGCNLVFNTDAGSVCKFKPSVTLSQDMLSYEPGEINRFPIYSRSRVRLELLRAIQNRSFRNSSGVIFLTDYARRMIEKSCGPIERSRIIPHGVGQEFHDNYSGKEFKSKEARLLYVSNAQLYKHQWNVVTAVANLRKKGLHVSLLLIGGGKGVAQFKLEAAMRRADPGGEFIRQIGFVQNNLIPKYLANADVFIFASSCENMPITLLEAMASGLPIASSNRGPMPELLRDGGVYFDPEKPEEIAVAIEAILNDRFFARKIGANAKQIARVFSWEKCANETFVFLSEIGRKEGLI